MGFWDILYEGVSASASKRLRDFWANDKSQVRLKLQKGNPQIAPPEMNYNIGGTQGLTVTEAYLRLETDLIAKYAEIEAMETYGDLSTVLNVIADNTAQFDVERRKQMWVTSTDRVVLKTLEDLFDNTLRVEEELWSIARSTCKYGDDYEEILYDENGVAGLQHLRVHTMRRIENERGRLFGFIQDTSGRSGGSFQQYVQMIQERAAGKLPAVPSQAPGLFGSGSIMPFEPFDVVHFRLRLRDRQSVYGTSVLDSARGVYKRITLLEDSAMLHQLQRAQDRFVFYVDVGDTPPQEALAALTRYRQQLNKKRYIDPATNQISLKFNPLSSEDHILIPIRKGAEGSKIDTLSSQGWPSTELLEFYQNRLYASIGVPRSYFTQSDVIDKSPLSSKDIQFARFILRVQQEIIAGYSQVARQHLLLRNIYVPTKKQFTLNMCIPSAIYELAQMEVNNARADYATRMDLFVSRHWILKKIFKLDDDEIELIFKQKTEDVMRGSLEQAQAQAQAQQILTPAEPAQAEPGQQTASNEARTQQLLISARQLNRDHRYSKGLPRTQAWNDQYLFEGNREHERILEGKLEKLAKSDYKVMRQLSSVTDLLQDLAKTTKMQARR